MVEKWASSEEIQKILKLSMLELAADLRSVFLDTEQQKREFIAQATANAPNPTQQKLIDSGNWHIWKNRTEFYGDKHTKNTQSQFPVLTYDGEIYRSLEYGDKFGDKAYCRLNYRLNKLNCYYEPYSAGIWDIVCDPIDNRKSEKPDNCKKYLRDLPSVP